MLLPRQVEPDDPRDLFPPGIQWFYDALAVKQSLAKLSNLAAFDGMLLTHKGKELSKEH